MTNGIDQVFETIRKYSAGGFAELKLSQIKEKQKDGYFDYMKDVFSGKDNPTIEECELNAYFQFLNEYKKCVEIYTGWHSIGRVFILDTKDCIVLALYKLEDSSHKAYVHYNPLNVDLIEWSFLNEKFFDLVSLGRFELSCEEEGMIKQCDELIKTSSVC